VPTASEVLFVCVHNAGRSQMAAALLHYHAKGAVTVRSAGSAPAEEINPAVVEAMMELGIDLGQEFPKPLTDDHGLWGCPPRVSQQALPRLATRRSRRQDPGRGTPCPR
jgi:hypothetical protein